MLIRAQNLYKRYSQGKKEIIAVDDIDLEVNKLESVAIIGPSGAGKSTLLHLLGGLDTPTAGKVLLDGADLYGLSEMKRAAIRNRKIGFVFQFYHLLPEFTALENVMLPVLILGNGLRVMGNGAREKARDVLSVVGLNGRMDHRPSELSGGEAQRVAIARALINDPEILFCDEPTGNLDSRNSELIYELLFELKKKAGTTLVIVTHDDRVASRTKRVIHVKDGRIAGR